MEKIAYLNNKEIKLLGHFNFKNRILSVYYYYWINNSNLEQQYSFVDVIEFIFDDNTSLFFKLNDEDSGIEISTDFEFEKYNTSLQKEFSKQIRLEKVDASKLEIWRTILLGDFIEITAIREKEHFLSSTFLLTFSTDKLELIFHPVEGLVMSEYDDI